MISQEFDGISYTESTGSKPRRWFARSLNREDESASDSNKPKRNKSMTFTDMVNSTQIGHISQRPQDISFASNYLRKDEKGEEKKKRDCLFDPHGRIMKVWEVVVVVVMVFTTFVTPFEVAFILVSPVGLLATNIVVDTIFIIDIAFSFFLPYYDRNTGLLVTNHRKIAYNYLTGWFILDFIPVIPFDLIGLLLVEANEESASQVEALKSLRVLRVLKLLKILRLLRVRKIWARWHQNIPFRYTTVTLLQFLIMILVFSHWLACIFKIIPELERTSELDLTEEEIEDGVRPVNWITKYFEWSLGLEPHEYDMWSVYIASFYWAVMTLTTVGYGDVNTATDGERIALSIFMLTGAILYAYIVAAVCGIFTNLNASKSEFYQQMDELNEYVKREGIPADLSRRLRNYFIYADSKRQSEQFKSLIQKMSPSLQEEVSSFHNRVWVEQVPFVKLAPKSEHDEFIISLSVMVQIEVFPPLEVLVRPNAIIDRLYIIARGIVLLHITDKIPEDPAEEDEQSVLTGNIYYRNSLPDTLKMRNGSCFGHEIIYDQVRGQYYATTLTYCETQTLKKEDLLTILHQRNFEDTKRSINSYCNVTKDDSMRGSIEAVALGPIYTAFPGTSGSSSSMKV
mmetsp:Transcript_15977/g.20456  ORF Transcript_15977/g.20456 Transcript_15977/m.20456 type:complete len:626 (-) Transcript_15977:304-2181(-)